MKRCLAFICLVCVLVVSCAVGCSSSGGSVSVVGKTYYFDKIEYSVGGQKLSDDEKAMLDEMIDSMAEDMKAENARFVFEKDGVVKSLSDEGDSSEGTYTQTGKSIQITLDEVTKEMTVSGNSICLIEAEDGMEIKIYFKAK